MEIEGNATGSGNACYIASNVVVENVEVFGAKVPDRNGAAFRIEGTQFTLRHSFIHDNENGILCGANANANDTFINVHSRIAKPAHTQNNLFSGRGPLARQAAAVLQANYKADQVAFVDRAAYDLHPLAPPQITGAGSEPAVPPTGVALRPVMEYLHVASGAPRPAAARLAIGAYQTGAVTEEVRTP